MTVSRTGAEHIKSLRDGRTVYIDGKLVDDVTVHPATRVMVDEYVAWYDRHTDPAWQDIALAPPDAHGVRALTTALFGAEAANVPGNGHVVGRVAEYELRALLAE